MLEFRDHPKFVGVRHVTQDEPDDDFILRPAVLRGLKVLEKHGVPFDLLFYLRHLQHAARLARELPGLPLGIDHLAQISVDFCGFFHVLLRYLLRLSYWAVGRVDVTGLMMAG